MDNNFTLIPSVILNNLAITEIIKSNELTCHFGLMLTQSDAHELVQTRADALIDNGRIEFSGGTINKLIMEFCDSPYISQSNYTATLNELIETFYYFKNETLDKISDDELIKLMKKYFDKTCQGSISMLQHRELETLARNIRFGVKDYANLDGDMKESSDEEKDDE